jgi:hypothetical protein
MHQFSNPSDQNHQQNLISSHTLIEHKIIENNNFLEQQRQLEKEKFNQKEIEKNIFEQRKKENEIEIKYLQLEHQQQQPRTRQHELNQHQINFQLTNAKDNINLNPQSCFLNDTYPVSNQKTIPQSLSNLNQKPSIYKPINNCEIFQNPKDNNLLERINPDSVYKPGYFNQIKEAHQSFNNDPYLVNQIDSPLIQPISQLPVVFNNNLTRSTMKTSILHNPNNELINQVQSMNNLANPDFQPNNINRQSNYNENMMHCQKPNLIDTKSTTIDELMDLFDKNNLNSCNYTLFLKNE